MAIVLRFSIGFKKTKRNPVFVFFLISYMVFSFWARRRRQLFPTNRIWRLFVWTYWMTRRGLWYNRVERYPRILQNRVRNTRTRTRRHGGHTWHGGCIARQIVMRNVSLVGNYFQFIFLRASQQNRTTVQSSSEKARIRNIDESSWNSAKSKKKRLTCIYWSSKFGSH